MLTHPANYTEYKKGLLEESARLAGLDLASVRLSPNLKRRDFASQERIEAGELVAVYDFGGGTFDAALVRKGVDGFELMESPGRHGPLGWHRHRPGSAGARRSIAGRDIGAGRLRRAQCCAGLGRLRDDVRRKGVALDGTDTSIMVSLPGCQLRCA